MPRIILRLLFIFSVSAGGLRAQESTYILQVDVPVVSLDVSATDRAGRPVNNLSRTSFEVFEDGIPQTIQYFSSSASPYNILLLFDKSGSIQHKWVFMQRAAAALIASLRPQDRIAIGTFGYELEMLVPWTDSRQKALAALPGLIKAEADGGTDLYGALERALSREFKGIPNRRTVLVLTDGRDSSLYLQLVRRNQMPDPQVDSKFQKGLKAAGRQHIPIYFAAINTDRNPDPSTDGGDEYAKLRKIFPNSSVPMQFLTGVRARMESLASISGGAMMYPAQIDDIIPLYEGIGRELGTSYSLGYVSTHLKPDGTFRRIEVRSRENGVRLSQSRTGYSGITAK